MKRNILILFAVVSLILSLTGCGSSGNSNSVTPTPTTMTTVKVSLTENGKPATGAQVALYTPAAAMREGLNQAQNNTFRASIDNNNSCSVYTPTSTSDDGTYTFEVPTGEYTLIATRANSKAVVTGLRANQTKVVTALQATGTITGTVATGSASIVTGTIVYLENTSFVAFAKADGSFTMTGVPVRDDAYTIAAMSNQNGKQYTAPTAKVTMDKSLSASVNKTLTLEQANLAGLKITGFVKGTDDKGIENIAVMASDENVLSVGTTGSDGMFTIIVPTSGDYSVSVVGSLEESKTVKASENEVSPSGKNLVLKISTGSSSSYGSITGTIQISSDYLNLLSSNKKVPEAERYLVRLIGSSTTNTYYKTSMKVLYKASLTQEDTVATYTFDSVPEGTYSVLVDPAGNGFLGSIGKVTVSAGKATKADSIDVAFIKPVFTASATKEYTRIYETYPFISIKETETEKSQAYCSKLSNGRYDFGPINISNAGDFCLLYTENNYILPSNGKYEIRVQRNWSDSNTGLSGNLTGTCVLEYSGDNGYIGNIKVVNTNNNSSLKFDYIKYKDNVILGLAKSDDSNSYYYKGNNDDTFTKYNGRNDIIEDFSNYSAVYIESSNNQFILIKDIKNPSATTILDIGSNAQPNNINIIASKYISVSCKESISGTNETKGSVYLLEYSNGNYTLNDDLTFKEIENLDSAHLAKSPTGECYLAILKLTDTNSLVKIYKIGESSSGITYTFRKNTSLIDFHILRDGSFYLEFGNSDDGLLGSARIISDNNYEESYLTNRTSCFMDKQGFLYRFDNITNSIIKTATLDGKPIETYELNSVSLDGATGETTAQHLNGILGFDEDVATLYVW